MKFLKNLRYIDVLNFLGFLPFFFVLPPFVQIFSIMGVYLVYKKRTFVLFVLGAISIFLSYGFYELKNFERYVLFLVSLLIWAIYLQRTKEENFYLKISPLIFLGLMVVFFQNAYMVFYAVLIVFVWLYFLAGEYSKEPFKTAFSIFVFSLPLVVLLFVFFPRVSQKHFLFGFSTKRAVSGFSGVINTDLKEVKLVNFPLAEIKVEKDIGEIYLRGGVFYSLKNGIWIRSKSEDKLVSAEKIINYSLKEYPTLNRVIFGIDLPLWSDYGIRDTNFVFRSLKIIKKPLFVKMKSALKYELKPVSLPKESLFYEKDKNLYAQKILNRIKDKNASYRLKKLIEIFKNQKIVYTIKPGKIDFQNIIDDLFKKKKGFCVHFASAFALASRILDIPSRLVGGYYVTKGKNGFYKIYESNAHVWVEVLINGRWKRVDPTKFAYKVSKEVKENSKINNIEFYVSYFRFLVEEWVLRYNSAKQHRFFKFAKSHITELLIGFALFIVSLVLLIKKVHYSKDLLDPLYKKLGQKPENESVYNFLKKFDDQKLDEINELYNRIVFYKKTPEDVKKLKKLIKEYKGR